MAPGDETRPDNRPISPLFGNDGPADETTVSRNPVPPPNRGGERRPVPPPGGSDTPPYVQAPGYQQPYDNDAGLFDNQPGAGSSGRPVILANQADGWENNLQEMEVVRSNRTGLVLLFLLALVVVAVVALGLAARSVFGGGGDDSTAAGETTDSTSTTTPTETTVPEPTTTTAAPFDPATQLRVTLAEDPFVCDSGTREFALVAGADPNEQVAFTSPQADGLRNGTADANGELPIRWQCEPTQAGTTWELTATGVTSGRTVTFIFAGVSTAADDGSTSPTTGTDTTVATPSELTVEVIENPFACDGEVRVFAGISGADPNESVAFSSPQSPGLRSGEADAEGNLPIRWQCDAAQVGTLWELTATGETSGRSVTFTFTGG
ncbi:MAG: hypothetical protein AAFO29_14560 [Actinomycetota bacterium]